MARERQMDKKEAVLYSRVSSEDRIKGNRSEAKGSPSRVFMETILAAAAQHDASVCNTLGDNPEAFVMEGVLSAAQHDSVACKAVDDSPEAVFLKTSLAAAAQYRNEVRAHRATAATRG